MDSAEAKNPGNAGRGGADGRLSERGLFDKLVRIHALHPECLDHLWKTASKASEYVGVLRSVESRCRLLVDGDTERALEGSVDPLIEIATCHSTLPAVFLEPPLLSDAVPNVIRVLAGFADVAPGHDGKIHSCDSLFIDLLDHIRKHSGTIDVRLLLFRSFRKLIAVDRAYPAVCDGLCELAKVPSYASEVRQIDEFLDARAEDPGASRPESELDKARSLLEKFDELSSGEGLSAQDRRLFLTPPRLSRIPPLQVEAHREIRERLQEIVSEVSPEVTPEFSQGRKAAEAIGLLSAERLRRLELTVRLRIDAARDLLERRSFAKIQALEQAWPKLTLQVGQEGFGKLRDLEIAARGDKKTKKGLTKHWATYLEDRDLVSFLSLPPFFEEIYEKEAVDFLTSVPTSVQPSIEAPGIELGEEPPFEEVRPGFDDLTVRLERAKEGENAFEVTALVPGEPAGPEQVTIPTASLFEDLHRIGQAFLQVAQSTGRVEPVVTRELSAVEDPSQQLLEFGTRLFESVFAGQLQEPVGKLFNEPDKRTRLALEISDSEAMRLPWEMLYFGDKRVFMAQTLRYSLVRLVPGVQELRTRTLSSPLRVLAVLASPVDAPLATRQEEEVLRRTLARAEERGLARLEILEPATVDALTSKLRLFRPHVFHFVGHGLVRDDSGYVVFLDDAGRPHLIKAAALGVMLRDHNINFAVLNGCETGISGGESIVTGVAQELVRGGVPAVVATTRAILDHAALSFAHEFYRALADGYTLEETLVDARNALARRQLDWSAYALFVGSTQLDHLRLTKEQDELTALRTQVRYTP